MPSINRRLFLRHSAFVGAAGVAIVAPAIVEASVREETARERFDFHLAELKKAAMEVDPELRFNEVLVEFDDPRLVMPIMICAMRACGRYEGDGLYAGGWYFREDSYKVEQIGSQIDGERIFLLTPVKAHGDKPFTLSETKLEAFIGQKLKGGVV